MWERWIQMETDGGLLYWQITLTTLCVHVQVPTGHCFSFSSGGSTAPSGHSLVTRGLRLSRLRVWPCVSDCQYLCGYLCLYNFTTPTTFQLSNHGIWLHPRIYLFSVCLHWCILLEKSPIDGSVKIQFATLALCTVWHCTTCYYSQISSAMPCATIVELQAPYCVQLLSVLSAEPRAMIVELATTTELNSITAVVL